MNNQRVGVAKGGRRWQGADVRTRLAHQNIWISNTVKTLWMLLCGFFIRGTFDYETQLLIGLWISDWVSKFDSIIQKIIGQLNWRWSIKHSRCLLSAAHQAPLIMMTDGCLLGWVSDGKALSYSHFPLVRRQIRFFLSERYIVSLFHTPTVTVVNYWDTASWWSANQQSAVNMHVKCFVCVSLN